MRQRSRPPDLSDNYAEALAIDGLRDSFLRLGMSPTAALTAALGRDASPERHTCPGKAEPEPVAVKLGERVFTWDGRVHRGLGPPKPGDREFVLDEEASVVTTRDAAGAVMRQLVEEDGWTRVRDRDRLPRAAGRMPFRVLARMRRCHVSGGRPRGRAPRARARRRAGTTSRKASADPRDDDPEPGRARHRDPLRARPAGVVA